MYCWIRPNVNDPTMGSKMDVLKLCQGAGIWEPVIVQTFTERDYLLAMQLMVGKPFEVCVDGIDKPIRDTPPTYVSIPHLQVISNNHSSGSP